MCSRRRAIWPSRRATCPWGQLPSTAPSAEDGRYGKIAISSRRQRATRCVRGPIGANCLRQQASRNRRPRACRLPPTPGRPFGRRNGKRPSILAAVNRKRASLFWCRPRSESALMQPRVVLFHSAIWPRFRRERSVTFVIIAATPKLGRSVRVDGQYNPELPSQSSASYS
jgi:hypothetical protein